MSAEREIEFSRLFDLHPDAMYVQTLEGRIVACNPAAAEMTGYTREELLGLTVEALFHDDILSYVPSVLKGEGGNEVFAFTGSCRRKNGEELQVALDMRLLDTDGGSFVFATVRDISRQVEKEKELEELARRLKQSRKMAMFGEVAGDIIHYYNNVFTGILGVLGMAKQDASGDVVPLLKRAERAANIASGFTRRMLSFIRDGEKTREPTNVGELLGDVEDFVRLTFDKRIEVLFTKSDDLGAVMADPASLHNVFLNLLVNARDALFEKMKAVPLEPKLEIRVDARNVQIDDSYVETHPEALKGRYVRIEVADTGCGMDGEVLERVFEPFFTTKGPGKGTGLGLATVYGTVKEHGGWIEVESEPMRGSTFTVFLPAVTLRKEVSGRNGPEELPRGSETVLIVDDDEMIRTLGAMVLERQGYNVLAASNGEECLRLFMEERRGIDLVVLDLVLPVLSGREVLEKMRRIKPDIPVIVTSGHDIEHDRELYGELRADDYLLKPFSITDLALSVRNVLDRRGRPL